MFSFISLLVIIITTLYFAFMYANTSFILLVYMEIAVFIMAFVYLQILKRAIKGKIEVPIGISEAGKENLVKITVKNRGRIPVTRMKACIIVEDTLSRTANKYWMKLSEMSRGQCSFIQSIVFPGTGNYEITLKKLRIYDLTGLFHRNIALKRTERVQVMPKLHDVPVRLTSVTKNFYGEVDIYDENSPGHDRSELFQVREYQKGDRLQNIHWKLSAKQDEIMVKEHSLPKSCPVILFLDFKPEQKSKRSRNAIPFMEAAVSISFSVMDAGCPHYIVWYDSQQMDIIRVRVDDEESLFYFVGMLMKVRWELPKEDIIERYKEKYRSETYVWTISLDENLILKKGNEVLGRLSDKDIETSLSQMELLL